MSEKLLGSDHSQLAHLLANLGLAVYQRHGPGDFELALGYLRRALTIEEKAGPESDKVAAFLSDFAHVLKDREPKKAMEYLERARRIREKSLPPDSPLIADTLADIGEVHLRLREPLKAKEVLQRALQLFASSEGASGSVPRADS